MKDLSLKLIKQNNGVIMTQIILASASPRRKELLSKITTDFEIIPSNALEIYPENLDALKVSLYLSNLKAKDIHSKYPNSIVIGSDTTVIINNTVLGKPLNKDDAKNMLSTLSNNIHYVVSGVTIYNKDEIYEINSISKVFFKNLSNEEIEEYLTHDEYKDKAGSYAIQGLASKFIDHIEGDYDTIVGFPTNAVKTILDKILK